MDEFTGENYGAGFTWWNSGKSKIRLFVEGA